MKNLYTTVFIKFFLPALLIFIAPTFSFSQIFYSVFPDGEAVYHVSANNPGGTLCTAPPLQNELNVTNASTTDYASVQANITQPLTCRPGQYKIKADINLEGAEYLPAGYYAGFMIRTSALQDITRLSASIVINTYLDGEFQEAGGNTKLIGVDILSQEGKAMVYFKTSRDFTTLELELRSSVIPVNVAYEADVFYAAGFSQEVWSVNMSNFTASLNGNAAALSWTSANEANIKNYEIERSGNGINFQTIGTVNISNGSKVKTYHYTDANLVNGSYFYRVKSVGNDGVTARTNIASVSIAGVAGALVYPTIVKSGKPVLLKTSETGKLYISVYDMQGRLVRQLTKTTDGVTSIATTGLTHGMYIIKAAFANSIATAVQAKFIVD